MAAEQLDRDREDGPDLDQVESAVREALDAGLTESAEEAGLDLEQILAAARADAREILTPTDRQVERLEQARRLKEEVEGAQGTLTIEQPGDLQVELSDERLAAAERAFQEALVEEGAAPWLRRYINDAEGRSYSTELRFEDVAGLAEVHETEARSVKTGASVRLKKLIRTMPGGTIGISGPRGIGKTTLIRTVCLRGDRSGPPADDDESDLSVVVDAPVEYDGREFVLHLFSRLCEEVLGPKRVERLRGWNRVFEADGRPVAFGQRSAMLVGLALAGVALAIGATRVLGIDPLLALLAVFFAAGLALILIDHRGQAQRRARMSANPDSSVLVATATRHLRQIWFEQSFSSGWSGSIDLPIGIKGGVEAGLELSQHQLSFPDVVALLKDFLELLAPRRKIVIGIDELDKMDDETACRFLNEIKAIFRVKNCFFLLSVSEDAMAQFERRGIPFRDVFDSSFDEIIRLANFRWRDSQSLLNDRVVGLPVAFAALAHCMSAGLPRDMIRATRRLVELREGTTVSQATRKLSRAALRAEIDAARIETRRLGAPVCQAHLTEWMGQLEAAGVDPQSLLAQCDGFQRAGVEALGASGDDDIQLRKAYGLSLQLYLSAYHAVTMIEVFGRLNSRKAIDEVLQRQGAHSYIDRLAAARQAFSMSAQVAWEETSALRSERGLSHLAFPAIP